MLAHVLVGEPDSTSGQARGHASPGHALSPAAIEVADRLRLFEAVDDIGTEER
jgi:hypothetical protein